ncbi:nitric oxide reductase transcriptional regulator NorR [Thalassomonas actiniarum]|uniref:Nitric oxide reductase transcriptional regulator NorR n=1 Tax=Thalassomonas actiniarum TaxID=485447 RepID=A0AAE9YSN3_9GAMM|nr:nitric oxide reductase transcriptional regulator NorR [Thalassomonas actiniarum]WDE00112.1 nitric oxide reductase transcriptional regulator NorR [Thalassomonas actiniarum]
MSKKISYEINTELLCMDLLAVLELEDSLNALAKVIAKYFHADAVSILEFNEPLLHPVALYGFSKDTYGRRFDLANNPRLMKIVSDEQPTIFADDIGLPDPFDGLILDKQERLEVHSCSGLPIRQSGNLRGIITLDSLDLQVFNRFPAENFQTAALLTTKIVLTAIDNQNLKEQLSKKTILNQTLIEASIGVKTELVGKSEQIEHLRREINIVAPSDLSVLVTGETGVGKEIVAKSIHGQSKRFDKPLIYVNCAALPESIAESELFGHVKGAFTGATSNRSGKFELANGGTLFLDEVGELPLAIQAKILRAIQYGDVQRVGSDRHVNVDVRLVAATNRNLMDEVKEGNFREDLYHRLSVYPIHIPPLRDRLADIELLVGFFMEKNRIKLGLQSVRLDKLVLPELLSYNWPGNVRELEHVMSRAMLRAASARHGKIVTLLPDDIDSSVRSNGAVKAPAAMTMETLSDNNQVADNETPVVSPTSEAPELNQSLNTMMDNYQRTLLQQALKQSGGKWNKAAELLAIDKGNIHRLGKRLGLK